MSNSQKISIVIADDHAIFRDGLRRLLEDDPAFQVVGEAGNGEEALALVSQKTPDVLLLDLAMPKMPGLETLRELAGRQAPTRVLVLTAAIEKRQIIEALQVGARGIVLKDAATQILLRAIRAVLDGQYWVDRDVVPDLAQFLRAQAATRPKTRAQGYGLTRRETEILGTIVNGLTNKEIAQRFSLSEDTVKHHLTSIFDKLGVASRLELALFAINNRLIDS